ncbi:MAG TPA: DedA family protein [Candidatus Acidoferrum sp.]|nr:DedA family protein [Candidatus Acidoferrum sp.]
MELIHKFIDLVLHIDRHLGELIQQFGPWMYVLLFLIIFAETGLVVTPFLPGDSLLFAVGTFCALPPPDNLNIVVLMIILTIAAILGDSVNYWVGAKLGPRIFRGENVRFLNKKHLERTHEFYERYGGKTIIIARFIPIVRTFAPFVAGMGKMTYPKFMSFNVIGGVAWIVSFLLLGFFFGNMPVVKKNFSFVILAIIVLSIVPGVIEFLRERARLKRKV